MPSQPATDRETPSRRVRRCTALTTSGERCKRAAVAGLNVCKSHGGGTAASVRAGKRNEVSRQAATLWGITSDTSGLSVEEELKRLAANKLRDILALRIKISEDSVSKHIGHLTESHTITEYDIDGTVQSKSGTQETRTKRAGTSVWVQELHKTEMEFLQIAKLLHEIQGGGDEVDLKRIRMQTARETARLMKAFPGLGVDEVALEVSKRAS